MSHDGQNAQILGHKGTRVGQCRAMCIANVTSCPRNVASADTKQFGKAQSETCGQADGCALGADPLLRGYHWGMRLFVNHFPASQSRLAPAEVTRVGLPCKDCLLSLPSIAQLVRDTGQADCGPKGILGDVWRPPWVSIAGEGQCH